MELNEWDVNGTNVLTEKKKEFSGRKRIWAEGELEKSYPKQSEEFLTLAFGSRMITKAERWFIIILS